MRNCLICSPARGTSELTMEKRRRMCHIWPPRMSRPVSKSSIYVVFIRLGLGEVNRKFRISSIDLILARIFLPCSSASSLSRSRSTQRVVLKPDAESARQRAPELLPGRTFRWGGGALAGRGGALAGRGGDPRAFRCAGVRPAERTRGIAERGR